MGKYATKPDDVRIFKVSKEIQELKGYFYKVIDSSRGQKTNFFVEKEDAIANYKKICDSYMREYRIAIRRWEEEQRINLAILDY